MNSLACHKSQIALVETFTPVIGDIVGSSKSQGLQAQGDFLERACATSLWARYRMHRPAAGALVKLRDIIPSWPKDDHYVWTLNCLASLI